MTDSNKNTLTETLKKKVFHPVSNHTKELAELSGLFIKRTYSHKKILINAGEIWDKVFFVHQGIIRLFYTDTGGREFNKGFFKEGQLLWPVAPAARKNGSLFSIAALEDIRVSVCRFDAFYSWLSGHGYWEKFALPYAELFAEEKFLREYEFLMHSAAERFQNFCIDNPGLARRIPDYHLATYLGITNVSLSRIKKSIPPDIC